MILLQVVSKEVVKEMTEIKKWTKKEVEIIEKEVKG